MAVNISSMLSRIGQDGASAYCSTKGGMAGLNKAYERMLMGQEHKIQVKSLLPGYTMTPQVDKAIGRDSPLVNQLAQTIPLGGTRGDGRDASDDARPSHPIRGYGGASRWRIPRKLARFLARSLPVRSA